MSREDTPNSTVRGIQHHCCPCPWTCVQTSLSRCLPVASPKCKCQRWYRDVSSKQHTLQDPRQWWGWQRQLPRLCLKHIELKSEAWKVNICVVKWTAPWQQKCWRKEAGSVAREGLTKTTSLKNTTSGSNNNLSLPGEHWASWTLLRESWQLSPDLAWVHLGESKGLNLSRALYNCPWEKCEHSGNAPTAWLQCHWYGGNHRFDDALCVGEVASRYHIALRQKWYSNTPKTAYRNWPKSNTVVKYTCNQSESKKTTNFPQGLMPSQKSVERRRIMSNFVGYSTKFNLIR